jgi:hypothetical protein
MPSIITRTIAGAALGGVAIWGIAGVDDTTRDDSGVIVEEGDLGVFVTQIGDCFNPQDGATTSLSVTTGVPCTDPHHWQVIFKGSVTATEFEEVAISNEATLVCKNAVDGLIARLTREEALLYQNAYTANLQPTKESFEQGDRAVDCLVGSDTELYSTSLLD